jgi:hypothetical protein
LLPGQHGLPGWPQLAHIDVDDVPPHTRPLPRQTVVVDELLEEGVV